MTSSNFGKELLKSVTKLPDTFTATVHKAGGTRANTASAVVLRLGRWCRWSADHRHRTFAKAATLVVATTLAAGCDGSPRAAESPATARYVAVIDRLVSDKVAPASDVVEVWVCDVPAATTDARYGDLALRRVLAPATVTAQIGDRVAGYFATISHNRYVPSFIAGATVVMGADDTAEMCVDQALDRSSPAATTVLAIATAEHAEGSPGGWGRPGSWHRCAGECPARTTRRAAYLGASDFSPDWGPVPLLDLIEHELGHTLGLPHSGVADGAEPGVYQSGLDVMSDSASAREVSGTATRLDSSDTIGINRLDLGWMTVDDVVSIAAASPIGSPIAVRLNPSAGSSGTRLVVIELDTHRVLTVEFLTASGFDDHLGHGGVAIHLIDDTAGEREQRSQQPLGSAPPHLDLMRAGEQFSAYGWTITVTSVGGATSAASRDDTTHVAIAPTER